MARCHSMFYDCRFSGGDTMNWWGHSNPTKFIKYFLNILHSKVMGMKITVSISQMVKLSLPNISNGNLSRQEGCSTTGCG